MSKKHNSGKAGADGAPIEGAKTGPAPHEVNAAAGEEQSVQKDLSALNERLLRLQADFDNYRKRIQRDQADTYRRSLESLLSDLLPVLDHFELGLRNAADPGIPESLRTGFRLVFEQLQSVLSKHGLTEVETIGKVFDPGCHEAVAVQPSDLPADTIVEPLRKGYRLGGQLLRPAQVVIAGTPPDRAPAEPGSGGQEEQA